MMTQYNPNHFNMTNFYFRQTNAYMLHPKEERTAEWWSRWFAREFQTLYESAPSVLERYTVGNLPKGATVEFYKLVANRVYSQAATITNPQSPRMIEAWHNLTMLHDPIIEICTTGEDIKDCYRYTINIIRCLGM